jgi:sec-independent protein translocase protein TatA
MLEGSDLLIVAVVVLVLFGGAKLPQLARSLGEAQRELKKAMDNSNSQPPSSPTPTSPESDRPDERSSSRERPEDGQLPPSD